MGLLQDRRTARTSLGGWIEQSNGKPFPVEARYSHYLVERAIRKLDATLDDTDGRQPIYLQLDFFDPHQPFSIPDGFQQREKELRRSFSALPESYEHVRARDWLPALDEPKDLQLLPKELGPLRSRERTRLPRRQRASDGSG